LWFIPYSLFFAFLLFSRFGGTSLAVLIKKTPFARTKRLLYFCARKINKSLVRLVMLKQQKAKRLYFLLFFTF
jgi:hypothetical protein